MPENKKPDLQDYFYESIVQGNLEYVKAIVEGGEYGSSELLSVAFTLHDYLAKMAEKDLPSVEGVVEISQYIDQYIANKLGELQNG